MLSVEKERIFHSLEKYFVKSTYTLFFFKKVKYSVISIAQCGNGGNLTNLLSNQATYSQTTNYFTFIVMRSKDCKLHYRKEKNFLKKRITSNQLFSLVKPLLSRNFCEKSLRENFCNFHSVQCGNYGNLLLPKKYFVKSLI